MATDGGEPIEQMTALKVDKREPHTPTSIPVDVPSNCTVCYEDFRPPFLLPTRATEECTHVPSTCRSCISESISQDLLIKFWNEIECPECPALLLYEDVKRLANPGTFARYEQLSSQGAPSSDSDFVSCPAPSCKYRQEYTPGFSPPIVRCLKCGLNFCYKHEMPWHEGFSCDEYDVMLGVPLSFKSAFELKKKAIVKERRWDFLKWHDRSRSKAHVEGLSTQRIEKLLQQDIQKQASKTKEEYEKKVSEEKASWNVVGEIAKGCPHCLSPILKTEGCEHMTCTKCRHEFCWECLAPWRGFCETEHKINCTSR